jgi:hypothetical protein
MSRASAASKTLSVATASLGVGYLATSIVAFWAPEVPTAVAAVVLVIAAGCGGVALGAWATQTWARLVGALLGLLGTLLFGLLAAGFDRDPDASDLTNDLSAAVIFVLLGLSVATLIAGLIASASGLRSSSPKGLDRPAST